jgi:hypothetical protein
LLSLVATGLTVFVQASIRQEMPATTPDNRRFFRTVFISCNPWTIQVSIHVMMILLKRSLASFEKFF